MEGNANKSETIIIIYKCVLYNEYGCINIENISKVKDIHAMCKCEQHIHVHITGAL